MRGVILLYFESCREWRSQLLRISASFMVDTMLYRAVLAISLVAVWASAARGFDNSYMLLSPRTVRLGLPYEISVSVMPKLKAPVHIRAEILQENITIAMASGDFRAGQPGKLTLQVPRDVKPIRIYRYYTYYGNFKLKVEGRGGVQFKNETWLSMSQKSLSAFIQTDKAIYKPGQTVRFRAFATGPDLKPLLSPITVEIFDTKGNKVKQLKDVQEPSGIVAGELALPTEPVLGNWRIKATVLGESTEKNFEIKEYVLPKFEVTPSLQSIILKTDTTFTGKVTAKYTYGKPVQGTVTIRAVPTCCKIWDYKGRIGVEQDLSLDPVTGEAPFTITIADLKNGHSSLQGVKIEANVTETLTGITLSGETSQQFVDSPYKIEWLLNSPSSFKPGLPYKGYVKVEYQDGMPLGRTGILNISTTIQYKNPWPVYINAFLTKLGGNYIFPIPEDGLVEVTLTPPSEATQFNMLANYEDGYGIKSVSRMYSPSENYMQLKVVAEAETVAVAGTTATFQVTTTEPVSKIFYQILGRGEIEASGRVTLSSDNTFDVVLTPNMGPQADMVAYYVRQDGEIVNDGITFMVDGAIQNAVTLKVSKNETEPGTNVDVEVTADPDSTVCLLAVDQSVLLLRSGNDVTKDNVLREISLYGGRPTYYPYYRWWPSIISGTDAEDIFRNAGLVYLTDFLVYQHQQTYYYSSRMSSISGPSLAVPDSVDSDVAESLQDVGRVRTLFPETWLWNNITTTSSAPVTISDTVPDTITSWVASAFAVNPNTGLGVVEQPTKLRVFKSFFVYINLPYSVTRGEIVIIQPIVFNYLTQDMMVTVTLKNNGGFQSQIRDASGKLTTTAVDQVEHVLVKANTGKSVFFPVIPTSLGKIDVEVHAQASMAADGVRRQLLVEPEGDPRESNIARMIVKEANALYSENIPIVLPENVVPDTARLSVSVIGDLIGNIVGNLDNLIRLPTGCGEQTVSALALDVYVAKYLKAVGLLTGEKKEMLLGFIEKGILSEMKFQNNDGSFGFWGETGSTWVTAYVMKIIHLAKEFVYVDGEVLRKGLGYLIGKQDPLGSFPEIGNIYNTYLQGGSGRNIPLTAFVLIALKENDDLVNANWLEFHAAMDSAVRYLESQIDSLNTSYPLAIVSYALHLAESPRAGEAWTKLHALATVEGGLKYWQISDTPRCRYRYCYNPPTQEVETAAYALMVHSLKNESNAGIPILKWLVTEQNSYGGFGSTQVRDGPCCERLRVFKSFFVYINLPYSVTRGEIVIIQPIVFNYLIQDMMVTVTLKNNGGFQSQIRDASGKLTTTAVDQVEHVLVKANTGKSLFFPVIPTSLGKIDVEVHAQASMAADGVRRQLLVEPEGDPRESNIARMIVKEANALYSENIPIVLPENVVPDTARLSVSVIGDLIGNIVGNLDNLIRLPTGCGEQTVSALALDVYVAKYLKAVGLLTGEKKDMLLGFIEKGILSEMKFQNNDGSFGFWGETGSTW
ncbi:CD109 antigen-like [Lingula anatina]|uniref:CD109 antigen-like n=1 Tax=Lingula anatina TaxID=7574 RepID=A0A1S3HQ83_LINAN|nr:CD109 antigen-like [Lingula anatina]|eukprot:XP_013387199.1 CD109 antigen-like [Lingula anatina]